MNSGTMAVKKRFLIPLGIMLAVVTVILSGVISPVALADNEELAVAGDLSLGDGNTPARTIMIYMDGGASEANTGVCSTIIKEYLHASFNRDNFRIIVMTGGSSKWHLESKYLRDKDSGDTLTGISDEYNQVWEVYGAQGETEGYLRLLDGDGVSGDGVDAKTSENELMYEKDTLKNFINYAKQVAPAGKYDLILNDHGSGPAHGYGSDDHGDPSMMMSVLSIRQALAESAVVAGGSKFDFVDLDCCFNGNLEIALALSDYTDYFLGSADVDPFATVDYTALFNYLNENPNVDTKTFGKHLVDLFADYYNEHPEDISVGSAIVFCMVDTQKLKESDIVSKMQAIAEELRAQATTGSFYDEIRSTKDDYHFAYHNHQDLWTLAEQLGLNVYETDWSDPELRNAYTDAALEVQRILSDEDVIYSRYADSSRQAQVTFGRELDGSVTVRPVSVPEGGLSLFHTWNPTKGSCAYDVRHYVNAMPQLATAMGERPETIFYTTYLQAVIDYELMYNAGIAVSRLAEAGTPVDEIDYDKVAEYVIASENEKAKDSFQTLVEKSDRDVRAWLGQIIDIQKKEVLGHDKTSLTVETRDGVEGYRIDVHDTARRTIGVPVLRVTANVEGSLLASPTMTFYGQTTANEWDARVATDSSYFIPKFDGKWYAVRDSAGEVHVASAASDHSVYASISIAGSKHAPGELGFGSDGKAKYVYVYGNTKPFELADLDAEVSVMMSTDPFDGVEKATSMPFKVNADNTTLIQDTYSNLGITGVDLKLAITDMYEVEHEVKPSLSFDPNGGTWADGGSDVKKFDAGLETDFDIIDAPKRDGYTFVCWKGSEYQPGQKYHADSDHAFTAEWQKIIRLSGSGHVQKIGDVAAKESGAGILIGTTSEARRLEQLSLTLPKDVEGSIEYRAHLQRKGWTDWSKDGAACGTTGEARRLEAVQVRLTGKAADTYSVWYRVHSQTWGWLGWAKDGQAAGTSGQGKHGEAIEVQVLPKGQVPEGYKEKEASYVGAVSADVHLQKVGWTGASSAIEFGTTGQARRLEAVRLSGPATPVVAGISYEAHVQREGWMPAAADGALAGTTGQARRLEAVRVSLTGDAAKDGGYSVWYRIHSQTYGWLGWAHDGEPAGTTGLAKRAEAIDVQVLPQGQLPRGYDASKAACVNG